MTNITINASILTISSIIMESGTYSRIINNTGAKEPSILSKVIT
jgi:hypothetical protein